MVGQKSFSMSSRAANNQMTSFEVSPNPSKTIQIHPKKQESKAMRKLIRGLAAAATGIAAAGTVLAALSAPASADTTSPPPWDTFNPTDGATYNSYSSPAGYGSVGGLEFFNSAGQQITGGTIPSTGSGPIAAYIEGTGSTGGIKVRVDIALPAGSDPSGWSHDQESNVATSFPLASGAPSNLENVSTGPVYTGSSSDTSLAQFFSTFSDGSNPDAGYYQVRLYTTGTGSLGTEFNSADILVNLTNDTWTLAYPVPTAVSTSVGVSTTAGSAGVAGTQVPLKATVSDADGSSPAGGTVQFFDGATAIGSPQTVTGSTATYTYTTQASDEPSASFTAKFTPATGANYTGSTSTTLSFGVTPAIATTTTLTASPDTPVTTGTSVTLTAKVSDSDSSAPTGTVTFSDGSTVLSANVALTNVSGTYEATYGPTTSLSVATHSLKAAYNAPSGYANSTGNLSFQVTPSGDATNTALAVSPTQQVAPGASLTFTATVSDKADSSQVPSGSVQFAINGTNVGSSVTLDDQGVASAVVSAAAGSAPWTAYANGVADDEVSASFTPSAGADQPSTSGNVEVFVAAGGYGSDTNGNGSGNITTSSAPGTLTISTPWTTANPFQLGQLQLQNGGTEYKASANFGNPGDTTSLNANGGVLVADTGIGNQTWTASASVTDFTDGSASPGPNDVINSQNLEFTGATVGAISGNDYVAAGGSPPPGTVQISANNVVNTLPNGFPYGSAATGSDGLSNGVHGGAGTLTQHTIATSGAAGAGSVYIDGVLTLLAPTSASPGTYTATLTFTAV
jgi:Bacterial Ig-like domain (group 3)